MINATVSHELRNPLNSIVAFNLQKELLYLQLSRLINDESLTIQDLRLQSTEIFSQLKMGKDIQ